VIALLDWFAGKMAMLIFVTVALGALLVFAGVITGTWKTTSTVQAANDLARLIDGVTPGSSVTYTFDVPYNLTISSDRLVLNGIERQFVNRANPMVLTNVKKVKIENTGGTVNVTQV
jgi:hypothetical protein